MVGRIPILFLMFVAGPIGLFRTGSLWRAVPGRVAGRMGRHLGTTCAGSRSPKAAPPSYASAASLTAAAG